MDEITHDLKARIPKGTNIIFYSMLKSLSKKSLFLKGLAKLMEYLSLKLFSQSIIYYKTVEYHQGQWLEINKKYLVT